MVWYRTEAMNEKYKPTKTGIGIGLLSACLIALPSSQALAARASTFNIVEFSCSEQKVVGEIIELSVKVKRKGRSGTGTTLTLLGTQGETKIFDEIHTILDAPRDRKAEETFLPNAGATGVIQWLATVEGDEAHCTTTVVQGGDDGDDDDGDGDDGGGGDPPTASGNIIALHDSGSLQYDKHCLECHGDILSEESLDTDTPPIPGAHVAMRPFIPGKDDEKKCTWCHRTVDLTAHLLGPQPLDQTSANLRKHVNVGLCTVCHGNPARSTARQFYQVGLSPTDGPLLYDLTCAACHGDLAHSEVKNESAGEIAEEIAENEGGMGPLKILTAEEIQAIADALAQ